MSLLLVSILGWIAYVDARTHRISNRSVLLLTGISLFTLDASQFSVRSQTSTAVVVFFFALFLAHFFGLGMGDVKLVAVLALFVLPPHVASYQIFIFSVSFSAFIYALCYSRGELRKLIQIPLAPSIVFGTIITLLAK